jgi:hypothetical protein
VICRAAAKAAADASGQPLEPIFQAAAQAVGLRVEASSAQQAAKIDVVRVEAGEHAGEATDVMIERVSQDLAQTATSFADLLAQFSSK